MRNCPPLNNYLGFQDRGGSEAVWKKVGHAYTILLFLWLFLPIPQGRKPSLVVAQTPVQGLQA